MAGGESIASALENQATGGVMGSGPAALVATEALLLLLVATAARTRARSWLLTRSPTTARLKTMNWSFLSGPRRKAHPHWRTGGDPALHTMRPAKEWGRNDGTTLPLLGSPAVPRGWVRWIQRWELWQQRPSAIALLLTVLGTALGISLATTAAAPVGTDDLLVFTLLTSCGVLAVELSRHGERLRRLPVATLHINLNSVWTLAAAMLLPPAWATLVATVLYIHLGIRNWYDRAGVPTHQIIYRAATVALSCLAATSALRLTNTVAIDVQRPASVSGLLLAIAAYSLVNYALIAARLALARPPRPRRLIGTRNELVLDHTTLCFGTLAAVLYTTGPWTLPLLLPPLIMLHRSVLLPQLEHAATRDHKTGLVNSATWQRLVGYNLEHARRHNTGLSVLMVDVDHFKDVNDSYGHLVGDRVLRALAGAIQSEMRHRDLCGRFGGEEFVVALRDADDHLAIEAADRIARRIRSLHIADGRGGFIEQLTVSIGVASFPRCGTTLAELLRAADEAVYQAKDHGRDQALVAHPSVHTSTEHEALQPPRTV